jgi:hypothetical protein
MGLFDWPHCQKKNIHAIDNHKIDNNVAFPFGLNNVGSKGWIWTKEMGQSVMLWGKCLGNTWELGEQNESIITHLVATSVGRI